ncbi:glycoside hydrolase family 16 protein [Geodermatophilus sp. CPCC 205506]|uniref:glycoside hydrolase family 16 protein n=1 Tax=Geodermatophilus sp. CPCC 205506 TaxID=2936596 RepID=UPI003EEEB1D9
MPGEQTVPEGSASAVPAPPGTASPTGPTWAEEFDSLDLASSANPQGFWRANDIWQPIDEGYAGFDGTHPATWFLNPAQELGGAPRSPFTVADGVLSITARRTPAEWTDDMAQANRTTPGHAPAWSGGILVSNTSRPDGRFSHGYYEVRARFGTPGSGGWPALWFFAADGQNPGREQAEIDLLEIFGHASGRPWFITLHEAAKADGQIVPAAGASTPTGQVNVAELSTDTSGWHTYGMDWQEDSIRFYQDDVLMAEVTGADAAFFRDAQMSLRLNYAMDGSWFPPAQRSDATTPDALTMDVDYVRRWDGRPAA